MKQTEWLESKGFSLDGTIWRRGNIAATKASPREWMSWCSASSTAARAYGATPRLAIKAMLDEVAALAARHRAEADELDQAASEVKGVIA